MYHPEEGQRIEGCFVLFVKNFIFGFTCYPISGMVSGKVEIYVEENEISKRSEDPCVFYRREGKGFAILCCHVDDSLTVSTKDEDGRRIRAEFSEAYASRFDVSPECTDGDIHEY